MKIDRTLVQELKKINGDGGREARFAFMKTIKALIAELSSTRAYTVFDDCIVRYGRATVAICVAATLYERRERLDFWRYDWAKEVLKFWTNRPRSWSTIAYINDDGLHPTRICDYADSFIKCTME